jgi:hypothetical protein
LHDLGSARGLDLGHFFHGASDDRESIFIRRMKLLSSLHMAQKLCDNTLQPQ